MTAKYDNTDGRLRGRKLQDRRFRKWTEAKGCCARCGRLCAYPDGFQLDHIKALVHGGDDTDAQTQVLCIGPNGCHARKTAEDLGYRFVALIGDDGFPVD